MMAPATVISRNARSVSQVTRWFVDLADDYGSGQGLGLHHASWTGDGRADGGSNTVERNLHANRAWTCSNEEGGLCPSTAGRPRRGSAAGTFTVASRTPITRATLRSDPATREVRIRRLPAAQPIFFFNDTSTTE